MGVDTRGLVRTPVKDVFHVQRQVVGALREGMREYRTGHVWHTPGFKHPRTSISDSSNMLIVVFHYHGEERDLTIHFDCDGDYVELYPGPKLILSLGAWGRSVELMTMVLGSLRHLGPAWLDANDSDAAPDVSIAGTGMTFLQACLRYGQSPAYLDSWLAAWKQSGSLLTREDYTGLSASDLHAYELEPTAVYDIVREYREVGEMPV